MSCPEDETTIFHMFIGPKGFTAISCSLLMFGLLGCETEDPGTVQKSDKEFSIIDFDRLEIGSALDVSVEQSNIYSIKVRGDRRNIDDLDFSKSGEHLGNKVR